MYFSIIFKTILMYFFIILVYRIMGKKEVGQLSIVDLIVSILIAELVALAISSNKSIFMSIVPISVIVLVQILISYLSLKNQKLRNIIDGKPTILIKSGKLNFTEMSKLRYSLDDLIMQLRLQGISSIENVKYAILENNGQLSVFMEENDYPMPIILDGVINYDTLKEIKKDYKWLVEKIKEKRLNVDDIYYSFYRSKKLFIITKKDLL